MKKLIIISIVLFFGGKLSAQVNPQTQGGWYMYFWNADLKKSHFGFQGDVQYRNWNVLGDLEQLLLRAGATYRPKNTNVKFTLGYAFILSGAYGISNPTTSMEHRIYQEALLPHKIGNRVYLKHRFRFEQRFVESQNFRLRLRYNLFVNIPLNKPEMKKGVFYIALYNELFINTSKEIGNGRTVEFFDRNRLYGALGYHILDNLQVQLGYMYQSNNSYGKGQFQLSVHQSF